MYDALNVLMAMDIISKDKKEIQWKGLPRTSLNDIEELKVRLILFFLLLLTFTVYRLVASIGRLLFLGDTLNLLAYI